VAVNPSLSEGGCPFTFTEAVSVETPAVMARIPVTEEVITDPELRTRMLFDPYDRRDVADTIERGLGDTAGLLALQQRTFRELAKRTWRDVVAEHVAILDRLGLVPATPLVGRVAKQAG